MDDMGISQTPLNEALSRLAGERILEQRDRHGYYLPIHTPAQLAEIFAVRAALEGMAFRLAVESKSPLLPEILGAFRKFGLPVAENRIPEYLEEDKHFHALIVDASANPVLKQLFERFAYLHFAYEKGLIRHPDETLLEHQTMIAAAKDGNGKLAGELLTEHHYKTRAHLLSQLS